MTSNNISLNPLLFHVLIAAKRGEIILMVPFVNIKSVQTRIHIQINANNFVNIVFI